MDRSAGNLDHRFADYMVVNGRFHLPVRYHGAQTTKKVAEKIAFGVC